MIFETAQAWRNAPRKPVLIFGMSGLGKTVISNLLRETGDWYHYSIDYRIGTRYLGEHIVDNAKREAMKVPFLRHLLLSDSIYLGSNISFDNLTPVSTYLGKPGNPDLGGLSYAEYTRRQALFREAEISALRDTLHFLDRAHELYGYPNFICDTGGSICEWVDADNPTDPILTELSKHMLMIWIKGSDGHTAELIRRFDRAPKPMSYQPEFLDLVWRQYLEENGGDETRVDPDAFVRWTYSQALAHRQPRYKSMARNWGVTVDAGDVAGIRNDHDFVELVARALEAR